MWYIYIYKNTPNHCQTTFAVPEMLYFPTWTVSAHWTELGEHLWTVSERRAQSEQWTYRDGYLVKLGERKMNDLFSEPRE